MGLLITLYLIIINSYASVEAPLGRGISYIETWFFGCQAVIAFAILEYGAILSMKKMATKNHKLTKCQEENIDYASFIFSVMSFFLFNVAFWGYLLFNSTLLK